MEEAQLAGHAAQVSYTVQTAREDEDDALNASMCVPSEGNGNIFLLYII